MIVLITSRRRGKTVQSLARGAFGVPTPRVLTTHYERLFRAWYVPRATYIFSDFERLHPWELQLAAELYRAMKTAGLRCLNDPSLVMSRVELLTALERRGINPFGAYRGDEQPTPRRFPVFIRDEMGHSKPAPDLYGDQEALEAAKQKRIVGTELGVERASGFAQQLGFWWAVTGLDYFMGYVETMAKQTPADLQRYAAKYIIGKPHVVGVLISPGARAAIGLTPAQLLDAGVRP